MPRRLSRFAESKQHPMRFCYAVHTHWGGAVGMARVLDDFLKYIRSRDDQIWTSRCSDVAEFWSKEGRA